MMNDKQLYKKHHEAVFMREKWTALLQKAISIMERCPANIAYYNSLIASTTANTNIKRKKRTNTTTTIPLQVSNKKRKRKASTVSSSSSSSSTSSSSSSS
jgi:hypothetical protein